MGISDFFKIYKTLKNISDTEEFEKILSTGNDEDNRNMIVGNYLSVLKNILKSKPRAVEIKELSLLTVDGCEIYLDAEISHNDKENTERLMKIENLFADITVSEQGIDENILKKDISERLNEKIKTEWYDSSDIIRK